MRRVVWREDEGKEREEKKTNGGRKGRGLKGRDERGGVCLTTFKDLPPPLTRKNAKHFPAELGNSALLFAFLRRKLRSFAFVCNT